MRVVGVFMTLNVEYCDVQKVLVQVVESTWLS